MNTGRLIRLRNRILVNMDFKRQTVSHHEDVFVKYDVEKYKTRDEHEWTHSRMSQLQMLPAFVMYGEKL